MNTDTSNGKDINGPTPGVVLADEIRALTIHADVLALLPDPASARACLRIAEDAARAIHGRMAAAHVGADPETMIVAPEEISLQRMRVVEEGSPRERLKRVELVFKEWKRAKASRLEVPLDDCRGNLARCVTSECHERCLVVAPAYGNLDARDAFHDLLFNERKLVLVPPARGYAGNPFRHVLIGWKPHAHARDAVVAARRWLEASERVTVLCVNDKPDGSYASTARELLMQLGLNGDVIAIGSGDRSVAEAILDYAGSANATCLLIGAFKHGYILELLLGRVTRYLLSHATLPLMMKH